MRRRFNVANDALPEGYASVVFAKDSSDPANITIEDNQKVLDVLLSKFRRCLMKGKGSDNKAYICYLNDNNSNFYYNGTPAVLTGEQGDVMVNFPEFYYKYVKIGETKFAYRLAFSNIDGDWVHIERSLVGAYKAVYQDSKLRSISGQYPASNWSANDLKTFAQNRIGCQCIDYQQHCVIALMLYAKYRTRNIRSVLGRGVYVINKKTLTGDSNDTGILDTQNETSKHSCGLGLEGVIGDMYEYVQNVRVYNYIWRITEPDGSERRINKEMGRYGWIVNILAEEGPFFDIVPIKNVYSDSSSYENLNYTDRCFTDLYADGTKTYVLYRSGYSSNGYCGVSLTSTSRTSTEEGDVFGTRLAKRGAIIEEEDVERFIKW